MFRTIRGRIVLGFGTIIVMLMASTAVNVTLLSGINRGFGGFVSALDQTSYTVNIDLVMTKVRVRVNQWLRSLDPKFAAKADDLLTQDLGLVGKAASLASNEAERQTVGDLDRALNAYVGSWHAVRDYYAQEAKLYDERLLGPAAGIAADLARLRDSDKASRALVVQFDAARDDFIAAELAAMAYRTSPQPATADRTRAAIGGAIAKLQAAYDASGSSVDGVLVASTAAALRAWQDAFAETVKVTEARVARIASWTANEGEAMAVGANKLRLMNEEQAAHSRTTITRTIKNSGVTLYALSGGIILAGILLSLALSRAITRPIGRMTAALKALAGGDRSADVPETGRRDEIGEMAKAAQVFKETAIEMERMVTLQEAAQARETLERQAARRQTADSFDVAIGGLVGMLSSAASELEATAHSMSSTAAQTGQKASAVAASAEMASAGVQTVSAAAEQLTASIREISRQVAHSSEITNQAVNEARRTDGIVQTLSDTAQKIGDVVGLISNIAGQTNLLALNATIEAARAGDAGKGFAVVASEVKNLAQQTAKATGDIGTQVAQIQDATKEAVSAIGGISRTIEDVRAIAAMIAAAVDEQNAATSEIARSVQDTATSTRAVTEHIGSVSQSADETGQATGNVLSAAGGVSQQAARLQAEVAAFVASVRAG